MPVLLLSHYSGAHTWTLLQHIYPGTCSNELPLGRHLLIDIFPMHGTRSHSVSSVQ